MSNIPRQLEIRFDTGKYANTRALNTQNFRSVLPAADKNADSLLDRVEINNFINPLQSAAVDILKNFTLYDTGGTSKGNDNRVSLTSIDKLKNKLTSGFKNTFKQLLGVADINKDSKLSAEELNAYVKPEQEAAINLQKNFQEFDAAGSTNRIADGKIGISSINTIAKADGNAGTISTDDFTKFIHSTLNPDNTFIEVRSFNFNPVTVSDVRNTIQQLKVKTPVFGSPDNQLSGSEAIFIINAIQNKVSTQSSTLAEEEISKLNDQAVFLAALVRENTFSKPFTITGVNNSLDALANNGKITDARLTDGNTDRILLPFLDRSRLP